MNEKTFFDCIDRGFARKQTPDKARANSLILTAKERIGLIKEINEKNSNFVFEDYYTSLMEILQALCFSKGLNILNHICLGYFLRDELKRDDLYIIFEDLRYKRNSLTYYGNKMDFETSKEAIEKSRRLIRALEVYHKAMLV
jgi:uncharacterized protein (UPF0332 family)